MMADLAFRKNDYESAMFHFQQLLTAKPDYWVALARLVEVMRRTGHLEDVSSYLQKSEEHVGTRAGLEPKWPRPSGLARPTHAPRTR